MRKVLFTVFIFILGSELISAQTDNTDTSAKIYNGIKINLSKGIKLITALLFFDDSTKIPESNIVALNQNVNLLVQIDRGAWVEKNSFVSIGASEKISTDKGEVLLNEPDLFSSETNISPEDAQYVSLAGVITSTTKDINYFLVDFVIWDKWGSGKITGSYKFQIR